MSALIWRFSRLESSRCADRTERSKATDSLDWSKEFEILSISRLQLESLGISHDKIASLTDEDMERIADILIAHHFDHEFEEEVAFTARLVLTEKRSNGEKPMREEGAT